MEPFEDAGVTPAARLFDGREAHEAVLRVDLAVILVGVVGEAQAWRRCMRVGSSPEAELHALFIPLVCVMDQRDVQFLLKLRVLLPMALRETEKRLVAGVVRQRRCELVARGQLDAEGEEPLEQLGTVGVEEVCETHAVWVGAPFEEKVEEVPPSRTKCEVQRRGWLQVGVVAVAEREKGERVMSRLQGDLQCRGEAPALDRRVPNYLQRTPSPNPLLNVVEPALATDPMKVDQRLRVRCRSSRPVGARLRV